LITTGLSFAGAVVPVVPDVAVVAGEGVSVRWHAERNIAAATPRARIGAVRRVHLIAVDLQLQSG
jgi:hypothetical protein